MSIFAPFTFIAPEVASITPGPSATVTTRGLVSYFDPNNGASYPGSGSTVYDLQGTNNLTLVNAATGSWTDSGSYKFFSFPSSDQNALAVKGQGYGAPIGIPFSASSFSMGGWVNWQSPNGYYFQTFVQQQGVDGRLAGRGGCINYWLQNDTTLEASYGSSVNAQVVSLPDTASGANWYNVMITVENVGGMNRLMSVYINGVAATSSVAINQGLIDNVDSGPWIGFGGIANGFNINDAAFQLHGGIGPTYWYNTCLSGSEVLDNFNADKAKYGR